ncbi:AAA family ATPase [Salinibacterium sp. NG22]|uniref:ATP-binding protein n=1 Tax=Salinibacterium sp. NG22 TaxID=2792040 RepID=UPI0018CEF74B|nr:AAA family ATPase [Salinibacterium sp. NG22]MBH0109160.1 AAA family ATPase [Salinibacterium sp. NG22]
MDSRTGNSIYGRVSELAAVSARLSEVAKGDAVPSGAVIVIGGDSGVGKSALASVVLERAAQQGFDVFRTACEPFHEGMSYFPTRELVRQVAGGRATGAAIAELFGEDSPQTEMASVSESVNADPSSRREALVATFTNIILGRFAKPGARPILLFIDDLEHLDVGSADALICLVSRLNEGKVVLFGAYRTDLVASSAHPLRPVLTSARRMDGVCTMFELKGFDESNFDSLVDNILAGKTSLPASFYRKLYTETEGNPLFTREVLRMLRSPNADDSPGALTITDGAWTFGDDVEKWAIPDTVEEVIAARLDLLDVEQRSELEIAAVVGRRFAFEVFSGLMQAGEEKILRDVEQFLSFDLIRELDQDDESFEFSHGKIRDVLYESLSKLRRRRVHAQVAAVLSELVTTANEDWDALIGEHLFLAARHADAFPYLLQAARNAQATGSSSDAAALFKKAIEASTGAVLSGDDSRQTIQLELAGALLAASEAARAGEVLKQLTGAGVASTIRVLALNLLGDALLFDGEVTQALVAYDASRDLAVHLDDEVALCEVMCDLAELHGRQYERQSGINPAESQRHRAAYVENVEEAYRLHRKLSKGPLLARVLRNKAKLARVSGDLSDAVSLYRQSIESADARVSEHRFLIPYAKALRLAGEPVEALKIVDRVLAWSAQVGSLRSEAIATQYRATILMTIAESEADLMAAWGLAERALRDHRQIGFSQGIHETELVLGETALRLGRTAEALERLRLATGQRDLTDHDVLEVAARELDANGEEDRAARVRLAIVREIVAE